MQRQGMAQPVGIHPRGRCSDRELRSKEGCTHCLAFFFKSGSSGIPFGSINFFKLSFLIFFQLQFTFYIIFALLEKKCFYSLDTEDKTCIRKFVCHRFFRPKLKAVTGVTSTRMSFSDDVGLRPQ